MQIRLNYDRVSIKTNSLTLNGWFNDNNKSCTYCNNNNIEDLNHFLFKCSHYDNLRMKYKINEDDYVNDNFYRCLTPNQGYNIFNFVNECVLSRIGTN